MGETRKPGSHLDGRNSPAVVSGNRVRVSTRHQEQAGEPSALEKLTGCRIRPSGSRQHSAPRASGGAISTGETHKLSEQPIGRASAIGTKCKRGSHLHGRNSPAVGSGHRARVSTRHQEQAGEPSEWKKLTSCQIRPSDARQQSALRASGGAICMGENHRLSDQAIGLASALGSKSKRGSHLQGRNSRAV